MAQSARQATVSEMLTVCKNCREGNCGTCHTYRCDCQCYEERKEYRRAQRLIKARQEV